MQQQPQTLEAVGKASETRPSRNSGQQFRARLLTLSLIWQCVAGLVPGALPGPLISSSAQAETAALPADAFKNVDWLWEEKRQDPAVVSQMKRELDGLAKTYGDRYEISWRMARQMWWQADGETDSGAMEKLSRTGWDWGKKAVAQNPGGVEGNFWTSVCIGQYSLAIGILRALANGLESEFNKYLDKSIQINKAYAGAGPLRTKGNYWQSLPWPKRDLDKALSTLQEAVKIAPEGMRSRLYLAETYEKRGEKNAAIAECDKIIKARSDKVEVGDYPRILARATALKQRLVNN